jgi:hypothetical protein
VKGTKRTEGTSAANGTNASGSSGIRGDQYWSWTGLLALTLTRSMNRNRAKNLLSPALSSTSGGEGDGAGCIGSGAQGAPVSRNCLPQERAFTKAIQAKTNQNKPAGGGVNRDSPRVRASAAG